LSFDQNLNGDFGLENYVINKKNKDYIYTGCQILNRSIFEKNKKIKFSITEIWSDLIKDKKLKGYISKHKFFHVTNLDVFKKLKDL
jgi:hypothetical protein